MNHDGDEYRIVMVKTKGVMAPTEQLPEILEGIIEGLFQRHDPSPWLPFIRLLGTRNDDEKRITDEELAGIAKSLSVSKALGPYVVSNLILKVAIAEAPGMSRFAMQKYQDKKVFPQVWQRLRLVLLPKELEGVRK